MFLEPVYFFVMLCLAHSTLLQSPEGTVAVVGETVILKCRTDVNGSNNPLEWSYKNMHPNALSEFVYKNNFLFKNKCDRCEVVPNSATGQYDLVIKHVQLSDARRYTCGDRDGSHDAELIVFDRYPSNEFCTTTSTSNDCSVESVPVTMSCELRYRGNPKLSLEWRKGDNTIPSTVTSLPNGLITSSIQLQKGQTDEYTCRVKYHASAKTSRFTWSPTTNITPIATTTSVSYGGCDNKTIDCSDGKSPHCVYTWKDENGTEVSSSSLMEMAGKLNGNYTCLATCKVLQTSCPYVAKIFNYRCDEYSTEESTSTTSSPGTALPLESSPGTTSLGIYIPVSIALVILVSIIILLAILAFQRSLCVCSGRTNGNHNVNDVDSELGESNNTTEMTILNGTKSQEADEMLTRNTQGS